MPFTEGERQFLRQYQRLYYIWVLLGDKVYLEVEMCSTGGSHLERRKRFKAHSMGGRATQTLSQDWPRMISKKRMKVVSTQGPNISQGGQRTQYMQRRQDKEAERQEVEVYEAGSKAREERIQRMGIVTWWGTVKISIGLGGYEIIGCFSNGSFRVGYASILSLVLCTQLFKSYLKQFSDIVFKFLQCLGIITDLAQRSELCAFLMKTTKNSCLYKV